jgi:hypothetical protein
MRGLESGADDFLNKPVDEIALIAPWFGLSFRSMNCAAAPPIAGKRERRRPTEDLNLEARERGRLLLVEEQRNSRERIAGALV